MCEFRHHRTQSPGHFLSFGTCFNTPPSQAGKKKKKFAISSRPRLPSDASASGVVGNFIIFLKNPYIPSRAHINLLSTLLQRSKNRAGESAEPLQVHLRFWLRRDKLARGFLASPSPLQMGPACPSEQIASSLGAAGNSTSSPAPKASNWPVTKLHRPRFVLGDGDRLSRSLMVSMCESCGHRHPEVPGLRRGLLFAGALAPCRQLGKCN